MAETFMLFRTGGHWIRICVRGTRQWIYGCVLSPSNYWGSLHGRAEFFLLSLDLFLWVFLLSSLRMILEMMRGCGFILCVSLDCHRFFYCISDNADIMSCPWHFLC